MPVWRKKWRQSEISYWTFGFVWLCPISQSLPSVIDQTANVIRVGHVGSLSGSGASRGQAADHGIRLAFEEANKRGGVGGRRLLLISYDDASDTQKALTSLSRAIASDEVIAVLGELASAQTLAMAPLAQMHRVPLITPGATHSKITTFGSFIFRTCFSDPFQSGAMAEFSIQKLKLKRFGLLVDSTNEYSKDVSKLFAQRIRSLGGEIVDEQTYRSEDMDFDVQLKSLRMHAAQAVYLPGYSREVGMIVKQLAALKFGVILLGASSWDTPHLLQLAAEELEGSFFVGHFYNDEKDPVVSRFVSSYKSRFHVSPSSPAALGYDAALVLIAALSTTSPLTSDKLRQSLMAVRDVRGVTGKISIGPNGDAIKSGWLLKIANGKFRRVQQVDSKAMSSK